MSNDKRVAIHQKEFNIAWGDMDALGHVNNACYFDYFQEARIDFFRTLEISLQENCGPVVIHAACNFLKPVVYPATLTLYTYWHTFGNSSLVMDHEIYQKEILMAHGSCKIVWVDYKKNKSIPLPDSLRRLYQERA
ncbi:MAG: acyl-CoA thioesterase [Oligoflexia bacterium]|nr:acyl-CoA thioesterase [Oligoflexia bacterium]MBF0366986.1 acyl-CoA thioesterase [Oligoflexia bacterium]